jgi:hypothetical protein
VRPATLQLGDPVTLQPLALATGKSVGYLSQVGRNLTNLSDSGSIDADPLLEIFQY